MMRPINKSEITLTRSTLIKLRDNKITELKADLKNNGYTTTEDIEIIDALNKIIEEISNYAK